jgi:hypothetical protein
MGNVGIYFVGEISHPILIVDYFMGMLSEGSIIIMEITGFLSMEISILGFKLNGLF